MSTHDVPGANPQNNDVLKAGCWAEHDDGSLIYVLSTEDQRVIYEIFDMANKDEPVAYRDAMPVGDFQKAFSWNKKKFVDDSNGRRIPTEKWVWHDKTPFDWNRVMNYMKQGHFPISAEKQISAAAKVAESLKLRAEKLDPNAFRERNENGSSIVGIMKDKFTRAFNEFRK